MKPGGKSGLAAAAIIALGLCACGGRGGEGADCPSGAKQTTPSGYCVPRYVSLKRGEVFGRKGPGKDYPTVFTYHARGLPVQVVDETTDWRRICDPDGGAAWVSASMIDGQRTVMAVGAAAIALRQSPADAAAPAAYLQPRAVATLGDCKGAWCQVSAGGAHGWVKASDVWGLNVAAQCR
ncbi:MAG TPA: SH3 domain-containing protein [Caulobacteraceae bacterium]|jgi:SH3-like domain-containing protein